MSDENIPGIDPQVSPSGEGCAGCMSDDGPGWWFHLRRCAACGHIGCCDSSPSQHATKHSKATGHPFVTSFEPDEDWYYNYATEQLHPQGPQLAPPTSHPADQPVPGPAGAVPTSWQEQLH
ncbi:UBP-type zinc finger domain-containing protein [Streptomyces sp. NBC_00344]|uniref:UBP-type zinc finger domain-containing protein n=1 Tax=Streptomyces sp. NBC_00344 TaxID=2975720 RepID=UPI002E21B72C